MGNVIMKIKATEVFNRWAQKGKDEGMKKTTLIRIYILKALSRKNFTEPQIFQ